MHHFTPPIPKHTISVVKLGVLLICAVLLAGCLTMSPHHPIDGRWERVEGKLTLPMLLEFEPSGAVTGDGTMHGRFALAEPHRIALSFQQYAWKGHGGHWHLPDAHRCAGRKQCVPQGELLLVGDGDRVRG